MKTQGEENCLEAKERGLRMKPTLLTPWPQVSSLWNYEKIHFCGLSRSVGYDSPSRWAEQPWEANTQGCTEFTTEAPKAPRWETLAQDASWGHRGRPGWTLCHWTKWKGAGPYGPCPPHPLPDSCRWKNFGQRSLISEAKTCRNKRKQSQETK